MRNGIDQRLPEPLRSRAVEHLRRELPDDVVATLRAARGIDPDWGGYFHFGTGMAIRNLLRGAVLDEELPPVVQPDGHEASNWDDYYIDALEGALESSPAGT